MRCSVSVIIPCYRCSDTINRAVESILAQTCLPEEILLVEDCSDDDGATLKSLYLLQQLHHARVSINVIPSKKNSGPGGARNIGWGMAKQPYLAFLDADDSWHPRKLEIQYKWMTAHPEALMTGHRSIWVSADEILPNLNERPKVYLVSGGMLLASNRFPTRTVMLRRDIPYRFDPTKRYAEDYLLWLRVVLSGQPAYFIELPLAYSYKADFGAQGLTGNLWKMEKGVIDTYQRVYRDGLISRAYYLLLIPFSLLKFARRVILSSFFRR